MKICRICGWRMILRDKVWETARNFDSELLHLLLSYENVVTEFFKDVDGAKFFNAGKKTAYLKADKLKTTKSAQKFFITNCWRRKKLTAYLRRKFSLMQKNFWILKVLSSFIVIIMSKHIWKLSAMKFLTEKILSKL